MVDFISSFHIRRWQSLLSCRKVIFCDILPLVSEYIRMLGFFSCTDLICGGHLGSRCRGHDNLVDRKLKNRFRTPSHPLSWLRSLVFYLTWIKRFTWITACVRIVIYFLFPYGTMMVLPCAMVVVLEEFAWYLSSLRIFWDICIVCMNSVWMRSVIWNVSIRNLRVFSQTLLLPCKIKKGRKERGTNHSSAPGQTNASATVAIIMVDIRTSACK